MQKKALSLIKYQKRFETEKAFQKHLFRGDWPEGFRGPCAQHGEAYFQCTLQSYYCMAFGYQTSLIGGIMFHKTRNPLTAAGKAGR